MSIEAEIVARKFLVSLVAQILAGREKSDDEDNRSIDCSHDPIFGLCHDLSLVAEHRDDLAPFRAMNRDRARHIVQLIVRELGHEVAPWGDPLGVDDGEGHRVSYRCGWCGIGGVKLWRNPHGACLSKIMEACRMRVELLCRACVEIWKADKIAEYAQYTERGMFSDQLGGMLPAVPAPPDTYWGYTSVPEIRVQWWESLPDYDPAPIAARIATSPTLARTLLRCCRQRDRFGAWSSFPDLYGALERLHCIRQSHCHNVSFPTPTPTGLAVLARLPVEVFAKPDDEDSLVPFLLHQRGSP